MHLKKKKYENVLSQNLIPQFASVYSNSQKYILQNMTFQRCWIAKMKSEKVNALKN